MQRILHSRVRGKSARPARTLGLATLLAAAAACCAAFFAPAANADVIYNSIPSPQPGNLESWGFQAYQTSEFGGAVKFAGSAREAGQISVYMSSWACQHG